MGRKRQGSELFVSMNGEKVGVLTQTANGKLEFRYEPSWLRSNLGRPLSMSMPLVEQPYSGDVVENYFDNLLPDSQPIRNRLRTSFGAKSTHGFDLLWHIGRDCVGALQLFPEDAPIDVKHIDAQPISDMEIASLLQSYRTKPLGMQKDVDFRISVAGAQEKTALLFFNNSWHLPLKATPTSHIIKLPIGRIEHSNLDLSDSVENEWLCHAILKEYGLPVAHTEIAMFDGTKALSVERFDRRWASDNSWLIRLPQEDMCQALSVPAAFKYESDGGPGIEQIMKFLVGSERSLNDRKVFMTQVFLFWILGAIDGHAKNFSVFLLPGGAFHLTPAYDVISAYPLIAKKQLHRRGIKMAMSLKGTNRRYEWEQILARHWLSTAKTCKFPEEDITSIIQDVLANMDSVIARVESALPENFPGDLAESVFEGMREARRRIS